MQKKGKSGELTMSPASQEVSCKNCEFTFEGNFCPRCGQSVKEYDRPLKFFFLDVAGNIFAFDTRLWRSLKHVLLKPGKMETNYLGGKRISYMPPFRLYVFVSFIFFLTLSWATGRSISKSGIELEINADKAITDSIYNDLRERYPGISFPQTGSITKTPALADSASAREHPLVPGANVYPVRDNRKVEHIMANPRMYMSRFFKYASWSLFFLMPFYGFLLWMNFRRTRQNYISHFLLSINQHVFIFVILLLILLINLVFPNKSIHPESYLLFLFPLYATVGTVRLYQRRWYTAAIRLALIIFLYLFVAALVTAFIAYLSFVM